MADVLQAPALPVRQGERGGDRDGECLAGGGFELMAPEQSQTMHNHVGITDYAAQPREIGISMSLTRISPSGRFMGNLTSMKSNRPHPTTITFNYLALNLSSRFEPVIPMSPEIELLKSGFTLLKPS